MSDLAQFLLARISEDEATARAVHREPDPRWPEQTWLVDFDSDPEGIDQPAWAHLNRWSPTRVLDECEAKRQIVDECRHQRVEFDRRDTTDNWPDQTAALVGDAILGVLALPYADHPDYREEWRP